MDHRAELPGVEGVPGSDEPGPLQVASQLQRPLYPPRWPGRSEGRGLGSEHPASQGRPPAGTGAQVSGDAAVGCQGVGLVTKASRDQAVTGGVGRDAHEWLSSYLSRIWGDTAPSPTPSCGPLLALPSSGSLHLTCRGLSQHSCPQRGDRGPPGLGWPGGHCAEVWGRGSGPAAVTAAAVSACGAQGGPPAC